MRTRAVVSLWDVILSGILLKLCNQDKCKNNGLTGLKLIGMTIMAMCTLSLLHLTLCMGWSDIVFWPKHWFGCISEVTTFKEKSEAARPYFLLTLWFYDQRLVIQVVSMWLIVIPINFDPVKPLFLHLSWLHSFSCMSDRSEEHTSELQSHNAIAYAVFCL